jgi:hypothetical protein
MQKFVLFTSARLITAIILAGSTLWGSELEAFAQSGPSKKPNCNTTSGLEFCARSISISEHNRFSNGINVTVDVLLQATNAGKLPVKLFWFTYKDAALFPVSGSQISSRPVITGLGAGCGDMTADKCAKKLDLATVVFGPGVSAPVTAKLSAQVTGNNVGDLASAKAADFVATLGMIDGEGRAIEIPVSLPTQTLKNGLRAR